jgi:hypothetical protein
MLGHRYEMPFLCFVLIAQESKDFVIGFRWESRGCRSTSNLGNVAPDAITFKFPLKMNGELQKLAGS